jgi:hypothetical protein
VASLMRLHLFRALTCSLKQSLAAPLAPPLSPQYGWTQDITAHSRDKGTVRFVSLGAVSLSWGRLAALVRPGQFPARGPTRQAGGKAVRRSKPGTPRKMVS